MVKIIFQQSIEYHKNLTKSFHKSNRSERFHCFAAIVGAPAVGAPRGAERSIQPFPWRGGVEPPIFSFSSRRKRENGPFTVQKRKRRPCGGVLGPVESFCAYFCKRKDHTDLACLSFRCRWCGGRWGTVRLTFRNLAVCCIYRQNGQSDRSTIYSGHRRATAAVDAESSPCGLLVLNGTIQQLAPHLTALFSLWTVNGPFLFSLAREKRNGGFKPPSYGIAERNEQKF